MPEPPQLAPFDVKQRLLSTSTSSLSLFTLWKASSRTTVGNMQLFRGLRRNLQMIRLNFTGRLPQKNCHIDRMVGSNIHFLHQLHYIIQHSLNSSLHCLTTAALITSVIFGITYNTNKTKQSLNMAAVNNLGKLVTGVSINLTTNKITQQ